MKRGDVIHFIAPGDYSTSRPAVIIQCDVFNNTHATILVCLISSTLIDAPLFRLTVKPTSANGLQASSQIMADKVIALRRYRVTEIIGAVDEDTMTRLDRALCVFLGLA